MRQMARWAAAALLAGSALAGCAQVDQKINELRYSGSRGAAGSPSSAGSSGSVGSGGAPALQPGPRSASASADAARVLVIINSASSASREIGAYYVRARGIPARNVLSVTTRQTEEIPYEDYKRDIETPLRRALAAANPRIDFVVLTKGLPIRLNHANGNSVDSTIVAMDLERGQGEGPEGMAEKLRNPYFNSSQPFSSARAKMVLVTRLDGYTVGDAKRLVDNSIAARRAPGPGPIPTCTSLFKGGIVILSRMKNFLQMPRMKRSTGWINF